MKNSKVFALIILLSFLTATEALAQELWLRVGEVRKIPAPPDAPVRVGKRGILKAVDSGTTIQLIGLKEGTTTVAIGTRVLQVHVNLRVQRDFALALRQIVQPMLGLRLETDTHTLTIRGTLLRFSDWIAIQKLAAKFQGEYHFAAQALPDVGEQALQHLIARAQENGVPIVRFRRDPVFTAQLPKAASALQNEANRLFNSYGIRVESSDTGIAIQPLIRTRVVLAEVSRNESLEFGIQWPTAYQAQILPKLQGESSLMATLHALEARGQAQILASPNIICRSGGEARFHAGGEFPIRVASRHARDVVWKSHGVILNVKPKADFHGAMSLEIETEVSLLDMANAVEGVPALKSNAVKSHFDLPGRRTIALSGLLRQELGDSTEGLPQLSRIPILGRLFSSQRFMKRQTELVIFVTPEIYVPESSEKIEMPAGWIRHAI